MHLLVIGKYKNSHLEALELDYLKRLKRHRFEIHELKPSAETPEKEWQQIQKKISDIHPQKIIGLTEEGELLSTQKFASKIESLPANTCFVIGGAEGLTKSFKSECDELISLSPLTFPHKLARLVLVEQIYRAQTVSQGHPYHNA